MVLLFPGEGGDVDLFYPGELGHLDGAWSVLDVGGVGVVAGLGCFAAFPTAAAGVSCPGEVSLGDSGEDGVAVGAVAFGALVCLGAGVGFHGARSSCGSNVFY